MCCGQDTLESIRCSKRQEAWSMLFWRMTDAQVWLGSAPYKLAYLSMAMFETKSPGHSGQKSLMVKASSTNITG